MFFNAVEMPSLRETKDHIASVRGTLKITSAMKLVASAKLRKAQKQIETLRPYERELSGIYASLIAGCSQLRGGSPGKTFASLHPSQPNGWAPPIHVAMGGHGFSAETASSASASGNPSNVPEGGHGFSEVNANSAFAPTEGGHDLSGESGKVAIVAVASNSSLCGGFNANVARKVQEVAAGCGGDVEVHSLGRKIAEAMRRAGMPSPADYSDLVAHPTYDNITALARELVGRYESGELSRVVLVYSHFVSTAKQVVTVETYLPFVPEVPEGVDCCDASAYIVEPSAAEVADQMLPQLMMLKFYAAVLDSAASEHAARMLAMQAATDNANDLLSQLTLEYNKARQQKITAEILDLVGGSMQ